MMVMAVVMVLTDIRRLVELELLNVKLLLMLILRIWQT